LLVPTAALLPFVLSRIATVEVAIWEDAMMILQAREEQEAGCSSLLAVRQNSRGTSRKNRRGFAAAFDPRAMIVPPKSSNNYCAASE